jgi:hypothetical protein
MLGWMTSARSAEGGIVAATSTTDEYDIGTDLAATAVERGDR